MSESSIFDPLVEIKDKLFNTNYPYEAAVQNGFKGTEDDWYRHLSSCHSDKHVWGKKNFKLAWVTEEDIDAMIEGTYTGEEDIKIFKVEGETLNIGKE